MGFQREAARVRDDSLTDRARFNSLSWAIWLGAPLGFRATWTYLEDATGLGFHDPAMLVPAIDLFEAERAVHQRLVADDVAFRRSEKAQGIRQVPPARVTATSPRRWHGDERRGALHVLRRARVPWSTRMPQPELINRSWGGQALAQMADHPIGVDVLRAVDDALEGRALDAVTLQGHLRWARTARRCGRDSEASAVLAERVETLLGQIHLAVHGPQPLRSEWAFLPGGSVEAAPRG